MGPDINNPLTIGLVAFAVIVAGAFAGWKGRDHLPDHHRTEETKSVVSVSMTVVATISALVLGLLISNANTSFSRLGGRVTSLSAQILRLDQVLRRYGSRYRPGSKLVTTVCRAEGCPAVPRKCKCSAPQSMDLRTAPERRGFAPCVETGKCSRPVVAGSGFATCGQDRKLTVVARTAGWTGNAKGVRRSSGLLAGFAVR